MLLLLFVYDINTQSIFIDTLKNQYRLKKKKKNKRKYYVHRYKIFIYIFFLPNTS